MALIRAEDSARAPFLAFSFVISACAGQVPAPPPSVALPPPLAADPANWPAIDSDAVQMEYGPPAFVRCETGSELWRYDSEKCAAFFFLNAEEGALHLRLVQTVARTSDTLSDEACLRILRARASQMS
jgi:hypothetical protein